MFNSCNSSVDALNLKSDRYFFEAAAAFMCFSFVTLDGFPFVTVFFFDKLARLAMVFDFPVLVFNFSFFVCASSSFSS